MSFLWKRTRDEAGKSVLHQIDLDTVQIKSPTLVYLSGFPATDNRPGFIAGSIKRMEELTKGHAESNPDLNIYAWSYSNLRNVFNVIAYNLRPATYASPDGRKIADKLILPLVSANGAPLTEEAASKNLRNLTFFGFSAGTGLAQQVYNAALQGMQKTGWKKERAQKMLNEIPLVCVGNVSRPTKEKGRFTTVYLVGNNDITTRLKNRVFRALNLRSIFERFSRRLKVRDLSPNSVMITAPTPRKLWEWNYLANGLKEKRPIKALFPQWLQIRSHHEFAHYVTRDDEHSQFSQIAMHALLNAVNRTAAPSPHGLLEPATLKDAPETAAYVARIAEAKKRRPRL